MRHVSWTGIARGRAAICPQGIRADGDNGIFRHWGIHCCEDIGHMVFNLIEAGNFREDRGRFDGGFQERL